MLRSWKTDTVLIHLDRNRDQNKLDRGHGRSVPCRRRQQVHDMVARQFRALRRLRAWASCRGRERESGWGRGGGSGQTDANPRSSGFPSVTALLPKRIGPYIVLIAPAPVTSTTRHSGERLAGALSDLGGERCARTG